MTAPVPFIKNLAIMASAGTGKTYQLAMRFISLLLSGAKPEEIAALTFSRKAAGEILEKIVSLLLELIRREDKRCEAVKNGFIPPGTTADQLSRVLRDILSCRHKLHIETNDSFLFQIIQAAPAEFGIRGEIAMINENDDRPRQRALLRTLHDPRFAGSDPESRSRRNEIYQVLRDVSFGKGKPTLYGEITELLKNHYRAFLAFPRTEHWTLPARRPAPEERLTAGQLAEHRREFLERLEEAVCAGHIKENRAKNRLITLADEMDKVPAEHAAWPDLQGAAKKLIPFYKNIRDNNKDLPEMPSESDTAVWTFHGKENILNGRILQFLELWKRHLVALEYFALEKKTRAVYAIMNLFDASFSAQTRAAGKITFADILFLINSKRKNDLGTLQVLQERLGMTIGHYLLDEFQDTSTSQWLAFEDLALNVIQDDGSSRFTSFFMVGDIKQSIYQWREGNPALFMKICNEQGILPEDTADRTDATGLLKSLSRSFRSSHPVLKLVNDVFAPEEDTAFPDRLNEQAGIFAEQVKKMRFERHESGLDDKDHPESGCSLILTTQAGDDEEHARITWETICALIRKLDPFSPKREKPLSVAILFRKNDRLRECYEAMKSIAPELNVSMDGYVALKNSMAYAVFRQLLRLAAHPGDSTAGAYLSMIRLADGSGGLDVIRERLFPEESECDLSRRIREELDQAGPGSLLQRFRSAFPEVEWESEYMECLENALSAGETEGTGLSLDERIAMLDTYNGPQKSMAKTVQLMTIHKSKGLGFDIVILPDNAGTVHSDHGDIVTNEECNACYFEPGAVFLSQFKKIEDNAKFRRENGIYELGCTVYVSLTRAKRSTIVILPEEKKDCEARTLQQADILRRAGEIGTPVESKEDTDRFLEGLTPFSRGEKLPLKPIYCAGDPFWAEQKITQKKKTEKKASDGEKDFRTRLRTQGKAQKTVAVFSHHIMRPDETEAVPPSFHPFEIRPEARFLAGTAADFGTCVHEILRDLEWLGTEEETKEFLRRSEADPEAVRLLEKALSKPDIANRLRHPDSEHTKLFREQPFLLRIEEGDTPVSGIIDRAAVEYDESGKPVRAEIIDYKTDRADDPEAFRNRYRRQLEIYRRAMSELTGLPEQEIACTILALRPGLAIPL